MIPRATWLALSILFVAGCQTAPQVNSGTAVAVSDILKTVQVSIDDVRKRQDALSLAQDRKDSEQDKTSQFVADRLYVASYANDNNPSQTAYSGLVKANLEPAAKVLPQPSAAARAWAVNDLQASLSDERKAKEELAARYAQLQKDADALKKTNEVTAADVKTKESELGAATETVKTNVKRLADKDAQVKIEAAEAEQARKIASGEKAAASRLKVATTFMAVGGIVIVAAIVATVLHVSAVLLPGIATGLGLLVIGWLITYVEQLLQQAWFQWLVGSIVVSSLAFLAYVFWRAIKQRTKATLDAKISTATIGALQDAKNDDAKLGTTNFQAIKPYLTEWHQTVDGKEDAQVKAEIDKRLVAMNLVAPVPTPGATTPHLPPVAKPA